MEKVKAPDRNFPSSMEPDGSAPRSEQPITGPYSNPHIPELFI
jgi:hypothetical protein